MNSFTIEPTEFSLIVPIWKTSLWPNRTSPIEPLSAVDRHGKIDLTLKRENAFFWRALNSRNETVGVIGAQTTHEALRSRGIWVDPNYRNLGIGRSLIQKVLEKGTQLKCSVVWTMPRLESVGFYERVGFVRGKEVVGYEFGPHCIAEAQIADSVV